MFDQDYRRLISSYVFFHYFMFFYRVNNTSSHFMIKTCNLEGNTLYEFIFGVFCQIRGGPFTIQKNLCTDCYFHFLIFRRGNLGQFILFINRLIWVVSYLIRTGQPGPFQTLKMGKKKNFARGTWPVSSFQHPPILPPLLLSNTSKHASLLYKK